MRRIDMKLFDIGFFRAERIFRKYIFSRLCSVIFCIISLLIALGSDSALALKNPSAVYCTALGYEYSTVREDKGVRGMCKFPNDQIVDAWAFLYGKVAQEFSYCSKNGYAIKTVQDNQICSSVYSSECSVCVLEDQTEIEVAKLMNLNFKESVCGDDYCAAFMENFNTCPGECPSGALDGYCDGVVDGKCDPDCQAGQDSDCAAQGYLGDLNKDGSVDISDVILELRIALQLDPQVACSDVNANGGVDISDVILTLRMALDLDAKQLCT